MTASNKTKGSGVPANDIVLRLLIVDDDLDNVALMRKVFENEPVEVFVTGDPSEGLNLFRKKRPQIVTLGIPTPQIDGLEMMEKILAIDPGVDV